jgi:hypothetical protein
MQAKLIKTYQNLANTDIPSAALIQNVNTEEYTLKLWYYIDKGTGVLFPQIVGENVYNSNTEISIIDTVVQNHLSIIESISTKQV